MASEEAKVVVDIRGEDGLFWLTSYVNGHDSNWPIHVASIEEAEKISPELERLIKSLYRKAYRAGFSACQSVIKDALGLPR